MHPKKFDVEYNEKYIESMVSSMYDGSWISSVEKICSYSYHSNCYNFSFIEMSASTIAAPAE